MIGNEIHMDVEYMDKIISKHCLKGKKLTSIVENGLISEKIVNAFLEPEIPATRENEVWYKRTIVPESIDSIKVNPGNCYLVDGYNFLLSDFYLICYKGNNKFSDHIVVEYKNYGSTTYWKNKESIYIIPLEKVEMFKIEFNDYNESYYEVMKKVDPNQRAIDGACLGMMFGGPVGAVFGANEFYKGAKNTVETHVYRKNTYKLIIKFTNGDFIIIDDYWQTNGKENNKYNKMITINEKIEKLIVQSKAGLSDDEKRKIVSSDAISKSFSLIFGTMFIIGIIIFLIIVSIS